MRILLPIVSLALAATTQSALEPAQLLGSLIAAEDGYQIAERGQDFAVLRKVTASTDAAGVTTFTTNAVTLLENGLHYFDGE